MGSADPSALAGRNGDAKPPRVAAAGSSCEGRVGCTCKDTVAGTVCRAIVVVRPFPLVYFEVATTAGCSTIAVGEACAEKLEFAKEDEEEDEEEVVAMEGGALGALPFDVARPAAALALALAALRCKRCDCWAAVGEGGADARGEGEAEGEGER